MEKGLKKVFSAMGAVFCAVMMIMLCQVTNAVSYSEQTVTVDYDYQVIDSFEGVDAKYVLGYSDTGYYCCAGYVSRFYEEKFGVTVYNINMVDDKPSVYCYGKRAELREVKTPQAGDIMQDKDYSHVAIVKDCQGTTATLIEQNYKWTWNDTVYTVKNRKVLTNNHYFYRLYINGVAQSLDIDTTRPVIANAGCENITAKGFDVSCNVSDKSGVSKVVFPAYPTKNGESAKKYAGGKLSGGKASAYVSAEDYSVKSGEFTVKITAYDKYGNSSTKTIKASIKPAASVTLDKASLTLDKGKSSVISAKMGGGSGLTDFVSWKSSNSKIASVSDGKVTAKGVGRATITAYTTGGKNVKCTVTVKGKISDSSISAIKTQSYTGKAVSPAPAVTYGGKKLVKNTDYTVSYSKNTAIGQASVKITGKGLYKGTKTMNFNIRPATVTKLKVSSTGEKSVKLSWKKVTGADSYAIYRYDNTSKKWQRIKTVKAVSFTDSGLARAKGYSYKVKAVKKSGGKEYISASYSKAVEAVTKPAKASCTAKSADSGSIEVSWKAVGGASGYEIYSSSNGSDYVKSAKVGGSQKSAIVSGFEPYSLRMVKVRAYKTVNGKTSYGAFSQAVMVIVR
ncbi:Ig-like domain-containing protein [Ruminococcus sp.]|uniref:Ig-like domain-containing protein n=1 Tax=Ruminococcus sp. TaxID=41978 RepID=UPI003AB699EA